MIFSMWLAMTVFSIYAAIQIGRAMDGPNSKQKVHLLLGIYVFIYAGYGLFMYQYYY